MDFFALKEMKHKLRAIVAFGHAGPRIAKDLGTTFSLDLTRTLSEALDAARKRALTGDAILLCPACKSFDHFDNYIARGEEFRNLVGEIS